MKIQFIGATHEVTGSCTLLEVCGKKYLVDCGMEQGIDVFENVPIPVSGNTVGELADVLQRPIILWKPIFLMGRNRQLWQKKRRCAAL